MPAYLCRDGRVESATDPTFTPTDGAFVIESPIDLPPALLRVDAGQIRAATAEEIAGAAAADQRREQIRALVQQRSERIAAEDLYQEGAITADDLALYP